MGFSVLIAFVDKTIFCLKGKMDLLDIDEDLIKLSFSS